MSSDIAALQAQYDDLAFSVNQGWLLLCGMLIIFMQMGFAWLEVGCCRNAYGRNIQLMICVGCCIGTITWYGWGYAFAFGDGPTTSNGFIGNKYFWESEAPSGDTLTYAFWFFQLTSLMTSATIVSGAVAERLKITGYMISTFIFTSMVYPIVAHWIFSDKGWLNASISGDGIWDNVGVIDFAGSGVVHAAGGMTAVVGCWFMGWRGYYLKKIDKTHPLLTPRFEKIENNGKTTWICNELEMADPTAVISGVLQLWFCWFGFNCGSSIALVGNGKVVGRVAVNVVISPAVAGLTTFFLGRFLTFFLESDRGHWAVGDVINGILAGLVGVTGGCAVLEPWAAVICGFIAAFIYKGLSILIVKLRIDDPVDAFPVHFGCGQWGLLVSGLLAAQGPTNEYYGNDAEYGLFMGGGYKRFVLQIVAMVCIALYSFIWAVITFGGIYLADWIGGKIRPGLNLFIEKSNQVDEMIAFGVEDLTKNGPHYQAVHPLEDPPSDEDGMAMTPMNSDTPKTVASRDDSDDEKSSEPETENTKSAPADTDEDASSSESESSTSEESDG